MLKPNMHEKKAFRLSQNRVSASVQDVHAGQLFQLNDQNEWVYADGTRKAYPTFNNRFKGAGYGDQNERLEGLDDVTMAGMLTCFAGNYQIHTDQFDKQASFVNGKPLHPSTDPAKKGLLTMYDSANPAHKEYLIVGFVTGTPATNDGYLGVHGI